MLKQGLFDGQWETYGEARGCLNRLESALGRLENVLNTKYLMLDVLSEMEKRKYK